MKHEPKIKITPQSDKFDDAFKELNEMKERDSTLMDGLEDKKLSKDWNDEYDNILGDLIIF